MNINTVDLNLFLVFQSIYLTRSVTLAGDRIGMTQSATSNALRRMRERFGDPLFVRTHDGMTPTPLAERLVSPIDAGLAELSKAFDQGCQFNPQTSDRVFKIVINDVGQMVMMPRLLAAAQQLAPNVRFETLDSYLPDARKGMLHGQIDMAVGSWKGMGQSFYQQRLFAETFAILISSTNPLALKPLTVEDYTAANHISYRPSGETDGELQQMLGRAGLLGKRKVILTAAHSLGLSSIVSSSSMILTAPSRLAQMLLASRSDLKLMSIPFEATPFSVSQQWHERIQLDSGNRWLRELVFSLFHSPSDPPSGAVSTYPPDHKMALN